MVCRTPPLRCSSLQLLNPTLTRTLTLIIVQNLTLVVNLIWTLSMPSCSVQRSSFLLQSPSRMAHRLEALVSGCSLELAVIVNDSASIIRIFNTWTSLCSEQKYCWLTHILKTVGMARLPICAPGGRPGSGADDAAPALAGLLPQRPPVRQRDAGQVAAAACAQAACAAPHGGHVHLAGRPCVSIPRVEPPTACDA